MTIQIRRRQACVLLFTATIFLPLAAFGDAYLPRLTGNLRARSRLIGCHRAAEHLIISRSSHLDPEGDDASGIDVHVPATTKLSNVSVRNCIVRGFLNNFRVNRDGFRDLQQGFEYRVPFSRIELRNSRLLAARGSGALVGGYVSGVRMIDLEVADSGGAGIYLDSGSRNNRVLRSYIHDNGYGDVDPVNGAPLVVGGVRLRYLSTGREGLAIDGSRNNRISRNHFENNSYGAIFLFKNCGEQHTAQPSQWWPRRYGADGNRIHRNTIINEPNGIWIGSRMSQNQIFLDCSDDSYVSNALLQIHEDFAKRNLIQNNSFVNVPIAIRVEDDGTRIERNHFKSDQSGHIAVLIGTDYRTNVLGRPVIGTVVRGNRADIFLDSGPYVWIHGLGQHMFERNYARGRSLIHKVVPPPQNSHLFIRELRLEP